MFGLIALAKIIVCPLLVGLGESMFTGLRYASTGQWLLVGIAIAAISLWSDYALLPRLGQVGGFVGDTLFATVVLWASQFVLPGARVTWGGALGTGLLLGLGEIAFHIWVRRSRRLARTYK